jgi:hypothetical protein
MLNFGSMFFLVGNPSNQLIVIHWSFLAQRSDFFHGFLDGDRVLIDQIDPHLIAIDATGDLAMGSNISSHDKH